MDSSQWYDQGNVESIDGLSIFHKRSGTGEALFCLHGFPTSSWDFAPLWPNLTTRFDTIAHDLIGLGRSAKPRQPLSVSLQADMVEGLANRLGIRSAHILAHDLGDTVAQELLARQDDGGSTVVWKSCIFLNGGIFPEAHRPRLIQKLLLSPFGSLVAKLTTERIFRRNMTNIFSRQHPPTEDFLQESWKLLIADDGVSMMPRLIHYMRERWENRERWGAPIENPKIPLRLINGIQDPVSGLSAAEYYKETIPNADVILLEDGGHYPHVEIPGEVWKHLLEFHARLPGNRIYN